MRFVKAHGTGNDFIVLLDLDDRLDLGDGLVRALCDRRLGVGADGVLRIVSADDADAFMDHRNADGSRPEMCGNGVRVVAKHLVDRGIVQPREGLVRIGTRAGVKEIEVELIDGAVVAATVDLGPPIFDPTLIPFETDGDEALRVPVETSAGTVEVTAVSMGNPHAVIVVDDVAGADVGSIGPLLEQHERFPKGTNVEFAAIEGRQRAQVRVWERGVGETAACGTGACAALVALQRLDLLGEEATLAFPGGEVVVRYAPDENSSVLLTGPAVEVAEGELTPAWLAAVTPTGPMPREGRR